MIIYDLIMSSCLTMIENIEILEIPIISIQYFFLVKLAQICSKKLKMREKEQR